jgi:uncharacterized protein YbaR (Trm112 family)/SAM-dependent methyltransferase
MTLFDLLACPLCREAVDREAGGARLTCRGCGHTYPVVDGLPIMLAEPDQATASHPVELPVRAGYSRWKERVVLKSLTDAQIALDFGAGRQQMDDPRIIRMDLVFDPLLDVVGDVHALPFKADALDFVFGGAVMEHLPRPRVAVDEMYRVLKPGGYVYADWNFLAAYHAYPHHYFNTTIHGIGQTFERFTEIARGVGPHHGSAFALRSVLGTYLEYFRPVEPLEREFADLLHRVLWHPLDEFDERIATADRHRVAASVYFFGVKQPRGDEHLIPEPIAAAWHASAALQQRFPKMLDLSVPENVMRWASTDGARADPAIAAHFTRLEAFWKRGQPLTGPRPLDAYPAELMTRVDDPPEIAARRYSLFFSRPLRARLRDRWREAGIAGVVSCSWESAKRRVKLLWLSLRGRTRGQ